MSPMLEATWDVVTLGETMIRWTPPNYQRIEQATSMELHVGGSESNTAVGLARLGMRVKWLSRLTRSPLGRIIDNTLRQYGVDTTDVCWTDEDRVGLYFLEEGKAPRGSQVHYDRKGSAMSQMQPHELPQESFERGGAKLFHTTGITAALSDTSYRTATRACQFAKQAGWKISFDLNYRSKLWSADAARDRCEPLMRESDILFLPIRDARLLFGYSSSDTPEEIGDQLLQLFPRSTIVMTLGSEGSIACTASERWRRGIIPADSIGRLGGGDAFSAGFLFAQLSGKSLQDSLEWATACASLKYSIPGDLPLFTRSEVESLVLSQTAKQMDR